MANDAASSPCTSCVFCDVLSDASISNGRHESERILIQHELAAVVWDAFPVTPLHALIIPRRHVASYFDLSLQEVQACHDLLQRTRIDIGARDSFVKGFNIGVNAGVAAGQTIFHCHIHLIPRRHDDVPNPRGGVRHVIPFKGFY